MDLLVYNELPDSVKQELESIYHLVFKESTYDNNNSTTTNDIPQQDMIPIPDTPLPELPPWSQLDPLSLLALPDEMREQILKKYASNEQIPAAEPVIKSPPRTTSIHQRTRPALFHAKTPRLSKTRGGSNRSRTITQMLQSAASPSSRSNASWNPSGSPSLSANNETLTSRSDGGRFHSVFQAQQQQEKEEDDLPYDAEVWNALPQDMKDELLQEHRRLKKIKAQQQLQREHTVSNRDHRQKIDLEPFRKEPSLQDVTDIQDIRCLLHEWVHSFEDKPEPEDVDTIANYLVELVHYADLEKVQLLVSYLTYLIRDLDSLDWKQYTRQIQAHVSNAVTSVYGCPLEF